MSFDNYIFDIETYPNFFLWGGKFEDSKEVQTFEISTRRTDRDKLLQWLNYLKNRGAWNVGFNNLGFDYPITHQLLVSPYTFSYTTAYNLCQQIINSQKFSNLPYGQIRLQDRILPQIDLYKINHFDNMNKKTSLKALQFAMRSFSVEDLPIKPGTFLTEAEMDQLTYYNIHDIKETELFLKKCKHLIEMRKDLLDTGVLTGDVYNFSDVKIGSEYLIKKIGRHKCFSGNTPRQTFRSEIHFNDIILPKISYRTEPYQKVLEWFKSQVMYANVDKRPHLETKLAGLDFNFGVGGVHASVEGKSYRSTDRYVIKDIDVSGMYVAVAISNGFAPEHLGQEFVTAYKQLQSDRANYKKGTTMNATLKLAGNGAFGNSDNKYSCFFDPKYPKQITVNGQLQLLQLAEVLSMIPGLEIIQANTDGITAYLPREVESFFNMWCRDWENETGLKLEEVDYSAMWIRDVNNYLAITTDGKIKRKGAYWYPETDKDYDGVWNKDFSMMVVQKAVEKCLIDNLRPEDVIKLICDPFDYMIRYKTQGQAKVYIGEKEMLKTVRYYVSTKGEPMRKVAPPKGEIGSFKRANGLEDKFYEEVLASIPKGTWDARIHTKNKGTYAEVTTNIENGRKVKCCNVASDFDWRDVDYDYYINEIKKLEIK